MSGADKYWIVRDLEKQGWVEVKNNCMKPGPKQIKAFIEKCFYVYHADDVQDILCMGKEMNQESEYSRLLKEVAKLRAENKQLQKNLDAINVLQSNEAYEAALESRDNDIAKLRAELEAIRAEDWHIKLIHELRQELERIKPSWKDAPQDANWRTTDATGGTMAYWANKPVPIEVGTLRGYWFDDGDVWLVDFPHWHETLERRPGTNEDE